MKVFDRYVLKNLSIATGFIFITLAVVVLLTQSLRLLELVIESGASGATFWVLTFLALPRFFEVIMPLSLMAGVLFVYNRMASDSELVVVRSAGYSPFTLARPAIVLAMIVTVFLWAVTLWAAPKALATMYQMRQIIKAQFSAYLFREGVFNQIGEGLTLYIRDRTADGELHGLLIHDSRENQVNPSTVFAKRGVLTLMDETPQVVVYDGSRQEYDAKKNILHRLNFERYTIDLPDSEPVRQRWKEPSERTIGELIRPNLKNERDVENLRNFKIELHRRINAPLLTLVFTILSCVFLLVGPVDRRGLGKRIGLAVTSVMFIQGFFLAAFNLSRQTDWGLPLMYALIFIPLILSLLVLTGMDEKLRHKFLYESRGMS